MRARTPCTARPLGALTAAALVAGAVAASPLSAQDRLVGLRALGGGVTAEAVWFGGGGLLQGPFAGTDSLRLRRAAQLTVPVTLAVPLGTIWTVDVTSMYVTGSITYDHADPRLPRGRSASLSGPSDVRVRATGRLAGDALIMTVGGNLPTGRVHLDAEQLTAVRVLAAPALALGTPPVGAGASGTLGVLTAHAVGRWAVAGGVSYELHDAYAPIAALVAGAPTVDYRPGDVTRISLGTDGLVGRHRLSLNVAGEFYGVDRLRGAGGAESAQASSGGQASLPAVARVRLGPVLTSDAQLSLAVPGVREAVLWVSNRWRTRFARDGITVDGSSGDFLDGGARTRTPVGRRTDLLIAIDGRWQSGLAFDDALLTASAAAAGMTMGIAHRVGGGLGDGTGVTIQPFVRAQAGRVRSSAAAASGIAGGIVGLTILSRF